MAVPQTEIDRCGLSWAAKVICSGVFVSGRNPTEVLRASCAWMAAPQEALREALENRNPMAIMGLPFEVEVDEDRQAVRLSLNGVSGYARMHGDQGAIVCAEPDSEFHFETRDVPVRPASTASPWEEALDDAPRGIDEALDRAFANDFQFTNALLVLHRGRLIAERYRAPYDSRTRFEAWSMGKSIAASLVGVAQRKGLLELDEPAGFDAWAGSGDPRAAITIANLVNMASGLSFTGSFGQGEDHSVKAMDGKFLDHTYVYASGVDSYRFCVGKPLADAPDTAGRYRNSDPLLATAAVRERATGNDPRAFLTWPQTELFDRLGMTGMLLETDPWGHFLISGHDYGTARDWLRLGLLYLQRGAWGGEQLLEESFVEFVQTPAAKAWSHDPYYGGFFCTNATGAIPTLPSDAFWMSGGGRQRVIVVPSMELVVVRFGHMAGLLFGLDETLQEVYGRIVSALGTDI
ncbi:MAG: serine hydrolase [Pseudomonadota bacterium]